MCDRYEIFNEYIISRSTSDVYWHRGKETICWFRFCITLSRSLPRVSPLPPYRLEIRLLISMRKIENQIRVSIGHEFALKMFCVIVILLS